jgi:hypothetical protein
MVIEWQHDSEEERMNTVAISPDGRFGLSGSHDNMVSFWEFLWACEFPDPADWDEGVRPYLASFLTSHTPYAGSLPAAGTPADWQMQVALTRGGRAAWNDEDFEQLLDTLAFAGYGWLCPEGVRRDLEKMAADWQGPPPLPWEYDQEGRR